MRSAKAVKSVICGVGSTLGLALLGIATTPLIIDSLGSEKFGAHKALIDWGGYVGLLELGMMPALLAALNRSASRDAYDMREVFAAGVSIYRKLALASVVGAVLLACCVREIIPVSSVHAGDLQVAAALYVLSFFFVGALPIRCYFEATQRGYIISLLLTSQGICITLLSVVFSFLGWGVCGMVLASLFGSSVFFICSGYLLKRLDPVLIGRFYAPRANNIHLAHLNQLSKYALVSRISGQVSLMSDNVVIAMVLGPALVVPFFACQRLTQLVVGQLQSVCGASWPGLSEMHHTGSVSEVRQRIWELSRILTVVGASALVSVMAYNEAFVSLWLGEVNYGGNLLTLLSVANAMFFSIVSVWYLLFSGTGKLDAIAKVSAVTAVVNISVSIPATIVLGIAGPLIGTLAGLLLVQFIWLPILLRQHFGFCVVSTYQAILRPLLFAVAPGACVFYVARSHEIGWMLLLIEACVVFFVMMGFGWFVSLNAHDRIAWRGRAQYLKAWICGKPV